MKNNLGRILARYGVSQCDFARHTRWPATAINRYANGKVDPTIRNAWEIVNELRRYTGNAGIKFDDVFPDPEEVQP